jgi:putative spermidine/putrescine transport system permease protein
LVIPLALVLVLSFQKFDGGVVTPEFSLESYIGLLADGGVAAILWRTVRISAFVTIGAILLGFPIALQMRRAPPFMKTVIMALVIAPLFTSVIVRNVAWLLVLGRNGLINGTLMKLGLISGPLPLMYNEFGVVIATLHVYLTFLVLPVYASLAAIDPRIEESASSLGASPRNVFWRVTLPMSMPGLIAGASLVFILTMGLYLTPTIMGGSFVTTISMMITELARNQYNWPQASALSVLLLLAIAVALVVVRFLRNLLRSPS